MTWLDFEEIKKNPPVSWQIDEELLRAPKETINTVPISNIEGCKGCHIQVTVLGIHPYGTKKFPKMLLYCRDCSDIACVILSFDQNVKIGQSLQAKVIDLQDTSTVPLVNQTLCTFPKVINAVSFQPIKPLDLEPLRFQWGQQWPEPLSLATEDAAKLSLEVIRIDRDNLAHGWISLLLADCEGSLALCKLSTTLFDPDRFTVGTKLLITNISVMRAGDICSLLWNKSTLVEFDRSISDQKVPLEMTPRETIMQTIFWFDSFPAGFEYSLVLIVYITSFRLSLQASWYSLHLSDCF